MNHLNSMIDNEGPMKYEEVIREGCEWRGERELKPTI